MGNLWSHKSHQQTHSCVCSVLHRSFQDPALVQALHGITICFEHPPSLVWSHAQSAGGSQLRLGLQGHNCLTMGFTGFSTPAWTTSWLSFSPDLGVCRVLSVTYSHFYGCCSAAIFFLLKYVITSLSLMVSAFCWLHRRERTLNERKSCIGLYEVDTESFSFPPTLLKC